MNVNEHIDVEDLAMFAMLSDSAGAPAEERAHLAGCAECQRELRQVERDLALYAQAVASEPLPAGARDRFLERLTELTPVQAASAASSLGTRGSMAAIPAPLPSPLRVAAPRRRSAVAGLAPWLGWAVAAAALVVAFGLKQERDGLRQALHTQNEETARLEQRAGATDRILASLKDPRAERVSLVQPKAPALPSARASYNPRYGTLLMQASNLAPLEGGKVYELWVIPSSGGNPVAAGIFRPDDKGNAMLLQAGLPKGIVAKAFGITVEHAGGSATPTMPILLAGSPS